MRATAKFYSGWLVLIGLMITYAVSNGLLIHTLPIMYPTLIDEFGWDNAQVTLPATVYFVVGALTSPPAGILFDRYSPRRVMVCGGIGMVLGLIGMSQVTALWHMVVVYALFALSLSLCGLMASMVVVTRWFDARRGRATGLLLLASSFGGATFPWVVGQLSDVVHWRELLLILAGLAAILMLPSLVMMVRDAPAQDDGSDHPDARTQAVAPRASGPTLAAAVRSPVFYFVAVATASVWFSVVPLIQHQAIYLTKEVGIDRSLLPSMFSVFFISSMAGKLGAGWLGDYLNQRWALILSVATLAAGLLLLRSISDAQGVHLYAYAVVAGLGFSAAFTTVQLLVADNFAGPSYGKILAIIMLIDTLAGGLGTRLIGLISEARGSYIPAIDTMIGACVLAIIAASVIRLFTRDNPPLPASG